MRPNNNNTPCSPLNVDEKLDALIERVEAIELQLERQKGFIGGILFVFGIIAYFASNVKEMVGWFK